MEDNLNIKYDQCLFIFFRFYSERFCLESICHYVISFIIYYLFREGNGDVVFGIKSFFYVYDLEGINFEVCFYGYFVFMMGLELFV